MDAIELLAREDEYKRLNKQLEKKTESLMKEIETAMQKQDIFSEFSLTLTPTHNKHTCVQPQKETTPKKIRTRRPKEVSTSHTSSKEVLESPSSLKEVLASPTSTKEVLCPKEVSSESLPANNRKNRVICDFCVDSRNSGDMEFLYAFVSVNIKDGILPTSFSKGRASVESVCKFLSSKIKLMQEQIDKLQNTIQKKTSQCESHLTQLAELESERMSLLNKTNNMKSCTADMRAKYMAAQKRFEEKDKLYKEQRSETDKLSSELKRVKSQCNTLQVRFATQEQLISDLRSQLDTYKRSEKELRDSTRLLSNTHQTAISKLESQIKCLTTHIDKQSALIDNLRKQNLLLATDGAVKNLEREYCQFLEQDF